MEGNIISHKSSICEPCRRLKTKSIEDKAASRFCTYCVEALCDVCSDHHQASRASSDHVVVDNWNVSGKDDDDNLRACSIFCKEHSNKKLELFCKDHGKLCCLICMTVSHRQCDRVVTLDEAAIGIKSATICSDILENLQKSSTQLRHTITNGQKSIGLFKQQRKSAIETVDETKTKMEKHLVLLQENFKRDFSTFCRENIKAMDEKLKILKKQELLVNKSLENFKNKIENSSDVDVLMETNRLNYICSETDSVLESNDTSVPHLEIDLHVNECIQNFSNHFPQVGTFEVKNLDSGSTFNFANSVLELKQTMKLLDKSCITGVKFLSDGNMVLIDSRFKALYFYGIEAKKILEIGLPDSPWDVELLDKNILIVSFQERPYLQFVDVIKRKLRKEIKIDEPKRGIAVHSNQIILSSKSKISVIDLSGNEKYNFIAGDPLYTCIDGSGRLYFRDQSNKLACTDLNGHMIFTYNNPELKVITGITCDSENNIYVAGFSSHNIHQISPDGELIEIYSMGISKPRAIFLQKNGRLLLVSNNEGKEVNIFQFQMNSDDQADIKEDEFER